MSLGEAMVSHMEEEQPLSSGRVSALIRIREVALMRLMGDSHGEHFLH